MKISIIVAIDENNWIWAKNQLLCYLSDDLKNFKKITNWHTIIMWRNTFLSLPNWALPNRTNIVLSRSSDDFENCIHCKTIEECLNLEEVKNDDDKLYITRIHHTFLDADVFFPKIKDENRKLISKSDTHPIDEKNEFPFTFEVYEKIN